jgi:hypothetical protein
MFKRIETSYCMALLLEPWNSPAGRFYLAYKARHGFRGVIGNGVVDEYHTTSAPLFICPTPLLGKIYDAGMLLAEQRDMDAPLDLGWPPFCMGLNLAAPELPEDWQTQFLDSLTGLVPGDPVSWAVSSESAMSGAYQLEYVRCGGPSVTSQVTIIGTDAPLLPGQLERLADVDDSGLSVAIATGNRIVRGETNRPQEIVAVSEEVLDSLVLGTRKLLPIGKP